MAKKMRYGLIARSDSCGLGTLSLEFYRHLPFSKVVAISPYRVEYRWKFPDAYWVGSLNASFIRDFLKDLDLLLTFETPYNWEIFNIAREMGVKTVLIPNFEWMPLELPSLPDLCICPTLLDYQEMNEPKIFLPIPINRKILPFKLREKANIFLHNIGKGGVRGRNGTMEILESLPLIKNPIKLVMNFQPALFWINKSVSGKIQEIAGKKYISGEEFRYNKVTLKIQEKDFSKYEDLYNGEDILLHPQKYGSLSLPVQEAMSLGMPVISINKFPENSFLPKELLLTPIKQENIFIRRNTLHSSISPRTIAGKIDEIADKSIKKYSNYNNMLAEKWSWKQLKSKYLNIFEKLVNGERIKQNEDERSSFFIQKKEKNTKNVFIPEKFNSEQQINIDLKGKYIPEIKIGSIIRADNTGLGTLAQEFFNHFNMKALIIKNTSRRIFPERFPGCKIFETEEDVTDQILDNFLDQIDVLVVLQHPFILRVLEKAKAKRKKIIWIPMYECMPEDSPYYKFADLFICPSLVDYQSISNKKIFLPMPVERKVLPFKCRKKAKIFLHTAGRKTAFNRNGTTSLLKAIPLVKNKKVTFLIKVQDETDIKIDDKRVILNVEDIDNYWELFKKGDVFLFPLRYNGLCLPIQEALSTGMLIMATDFPPFNSWLPKEMLIKPIGVEKKTRPTTLTFERDEPAGRRTFYAAIHSPEIIAKKIDEVAKMSPSKISNFSKLSDKIANELSWEELGPKYAELFKRVVQNKNVDLHLFLNY